MRLGRDADSNSSNTGSSVSKVEVREHNGDVQITWWASRSKKAKNKAGIQGHDEEMIDRILERAAWESKEWEKEQRGGSRLRFEGNKVLVPAERKKVWVVGVRHVSRRQRRDDKSPRLETKIFNLHRRSGEWGE